MKQIRKTNETSKQNPLRKSRKQEKRRKTKKIRRKKKVPPESAFHTRHVSDGEFSLLCMKLIPSEKLIEGTLN